MSTQKLVRQGDVLLVPVTKIPDGYKTETGKVVLALGEHSGHEHVFRDGSNVTSFLKEGDLGEPIAGGTALVGGATPVAYVEIPTGGATLYHDGGERPDHDPVPVEPGLYEVRRQRELADEGQTRTVVD